MKLFLASNVKNELTLARLEESLGGFKGKRIAYIPTASNGEQDWGHWKTKKDGSWKVVNTLDAMVKPILLEDYRNESVIKELKDQDVIWFAGGMPGYLMYWIRRCKVDLYIKTLLKTAWYVGSSAGAMVAGQTLQVSSFGFVDNERGTEVIKPLRLVNFDIFPHFQDKYLRKIRARYTGKKIYLLKDGEEIIVDDGRITVIGEERIII